MTANSIVNGAIRTFGHITSQQVKIETVAETGFNIMFAILMS